MKLWLTNLLLKYTRCSVTTSPGKISLVWTWLGSSLRWDLLAPEDMQIMLRGRSMEVAEKSSLKNQMLSPTKKQEQLESLRRKEIWRLMIQLIRG